MTRGTFENGGSRSPVDAQQATRPRRSPLTHPLWWSALTALLVNDLVLKRSSMAGAVTGKLSDFAGLVVAPVLVASLVRAKSRRGRLACLASVAVPFIAIKLSSTAASVLVWAASLGGLSWHIWSDWTDLAALGVLPLAWRLSRGERPGDALFPADRAVHRLGALLGAFACVATSSDSRALRTSAYIVNLTHRDVDVVLFRANEPLDCAVVATDPRSLLRAEDFVFDRCWFTPSAATAPLDPDWRDSSSDDKSREAEASPVRACDAVIVRIAGRADTAVFWNQVPQIEIGSNDHDARNDPQALLLEQFGQSLEMERTPLLETWSVGWTLPPATGPCEHAP